MNIQSTVSLITAIVMCLYCTSQALGTCPQFDPATQTGTIQSFYIDEASGIAASRKNDDVFWTLNDSGDSPRIFAFNSNGAHLGIYNLSPAFNNDYEDIAIGPGPTDGVDYLYIGDIGDNSAVRSTIKVYRVPEPTVDKNQSPINVNLTNVETITLRYHDGARDAETLMIDPITKDIYIISKRETYSRVYLEMYPQSIYFIKSISFFLPSYSFNTKHLSKTHLF